MQFHQIFLGYVPVEDRLYLRLNTTDKHQYHIMFTRRFVKLMWPLLNKVMASDVEIVSYDNKTKRAAAAFKHEKMMEGASYQKKFVDEGLTYPWGKEPLLIVRAIVKSMPNGKQGLGFYCADGKGFEFPSDNKVLHYIYSTLEKVVKQADWDLVLEKLSLDEPPGDEPKLLN